MLRKCDTCGREYGAKTARSRFCSDVCRVRKFRGAAPAPGVECAASPLVSAARRELEAAGRLDTVLGQQVLLLAARLSGTDTGAAVAALSRELRATMAEALRGVRRGADPVDDLRGRRDRKRGRLGAAGLA